MAASTVLKSARPVPAGGRGIACPVPCKESSPAQAMARSKSLIELGHILCLQPQLGALVRPNPGHPERWPCRGWPRRLASGEETNRTWPRKQAGASELASAAMYAVVRRAGRRRHLPHCPARPGSVRVTYAIGARRLAILSKSFRPPHKALQRQIDRPVQPVHPGRGGASRSDQPAPPLHRFGTASGRQPGNSVPRVRRHRAALFRPATACRILCCAWASTPRTVKA